MYSNRSNRASAHKIPVRVIRNQVDEADASPAAATRVENANSTIQKPAPEAHPAETNWKEMAMRLQAEMENFRKRQVRRADDAITAEKERLLRLFLPIADNLARALNHTDQNEQSLQEGVELIYRELMRIFESEGVTRLETVGQQFTPELHQAVATVSTDAAPGTIVEELTPGYILNDKLLRPAEVVVAA